MISSRRGKKARRFGMTPGRRAPRFTITTPIGPGRWPHHEADGRKEKHQQYPHHDPHRIGGLADGFIPWQLAGRVNEQNLLVTPGDKPPVRYCGQEVEFIDGRGAPAAYSQDCDMGEDERHDGLGRYLSP